MDAEEYVSRDDIGEDRVGKIDPAGNADTRKSDEEGREVDRRNAQATSSRKAVIKRLGGVKPDLMKHEKAGAVCAKSGLDRSARNMDLHGFQRSSRARSTRSLDGLMDLSTYD